MAIFSQRRVFMAWVLFVFCFFHVSATFAATLGQKGYYQSHCADSDTNCIQRELTVIKETHHEPITDWECEHVYGGQTFSKDTGVFVETATARPLPKGYILEK